MAVQYTAQEEWEKKLAEAKARNKLRDQQGQQIGQQAHQKFLQEQEQGSEAGGTLGRVLGTAIGTAVGGPVGGAIGGSLGQGVGQHGLTAKGLGQGLQGAATGAATGALTDSLSGAFGGTPKIMNPNASPLTGATGQSAEQLTQQFQTPDIAGDYMGATGLGAEELTGVLSLKPKSGIPDVYGEAAKRAAQDIPLYANEGTEVNIHDAWKLGLLPMYQSLMAGGEQPMASAALQTGVLGLLAKNLNQGGEVEYLADGGRARWSPYTGWDPRNLRPFQLRAHGTPKIPEDKAGKGWQSLINKATNPLAKKLDEKIAAELGRAMRRLKREETVTKAADKAIDSKEVKEFIPVEVEGDAYTYDDVVERAQGGPVYAAEGKWIQGAVKKPGQLHRDLGIPQGEKIPHSRLEDAAKEKGKVGQRARFALNVSKFAQGGMVGPLASVEHIEKSGGDTIHHKESFHNPLMSKTSDK